nr:unnamed protein product [Callosobruchus analis]
MNGIHVYVCFITYLFDFSLGNDVVGCGGFLKSHVPIDFSKVEVKLVTKQGIIKDRTTAAPNNGYYFVPLYDKGEMVLELAPPPGWSFEPKQVEINVDGVNDLCSQGKDINFVFQGFGITGKVESLGGSNNGPKGVTVNLQSKEENRTTVTDEGGNFFFTPVYPGVYKVSISHPRWKIFRNSVDVQVAESNAELQKNSLIVQGYEVMGKVTSDGEPVKGVIILLYSQELQNKHVLVDGCIKVATEDSQYNKSLCQALTDDNGVFQFGVVPNGRYYLMAHFQRQNIHYRPTSIEFEVNNDDIILEQQFEIIGFSIPGKVLKSRGKPVPNAKIFVNGQEVTKTDNKGAYKLEKMKAGTYKIKVEADDLTFDEKIVRLNPSHQELPDMLPSAFKVCGMVTSGQSQTVTFTRSGSSTVAVQAQSSTQDGGFCQFLAPGQYEVQVVVGQDESQKGLQFFPLKHTIEVTSDEIMDLIFSQLKATVFGKVKCLQQQNCEGLSVVMKSDNIEDLIVKIQGGTFKFEDIFPGTYKISLSPNRFCWESNEHTLNINSATVDVTFTQIGYTVYLLFSHDAKVHYHLKTEPKSSWTVEANKGRSMVCLPKPGEYKFTVDSCHSFNQNSFTYDTENAEVNEIALNAEKHIQTLCIKADQDFGDVRVAVQIAASPSVTILKHKQGCYRLELMLLPEESAVVQPESDILFFTPATATIRGKEDCSDLGVKFVAVKGKVFQGKVSPSLEGVVLTVESSDSETLVAETDAKGLYKFPPLDASKQYKIQASKESYVLIGPDEQGNFLARKLAEVNVEVVDSVDNSALAVSKGYTVALTGYNVR